MPLLMLKDVPRYDCLKEAAADVPGMDPSACEAFLCILGTGDAAARAEANFLSEHGLSQGRLILLSLLDESESGRMRSSELAALSGVSRATITGLLDSLERGGLVKRTADPNDRRASQVTITNRGKKLLTVTVPEYFRWVTQALSSLSSSERKQLAALLRKTQQALIHPSYSQESL